MPARRLLRLACLSLRERLVAELSRRQSLGIASFTPMSIDKRKAVLEATWTRILKYLATPAISPA